MLKTVAIKNVAAAAFAVTALTFAIPVATADAQTVTHRPAYGCFKVSTSEAAVREKASAAGAKIASAYKGETLVKRRRFCTLGGNWCAVTTNAGLQGFVAKADIAVAPCPSRLAQ